MGKARRIGQSPDTCRMKRGYSSRGMAEKAIKRWRQRSSYEKRRGFYLSVYLCDFCRAFHVGHLEAGRVAAREFEG